MIQETRERLVRAMREDATLFSLTGGRIYPQDIATLINPKYPCITIRVDAGEPDSHIPKLGTPRAIIAFYSVRNSNQSYSLYEQVKTLLSFAKLSDSSITLLLKEVDLPRELFDPVAKSYNLFTRWEIKAIEP